MNAPAALPVANRPRRRAWLQTLALATAAIVLAPASSYAQSAGSPWENAVTVLMTSFTGPIARGLSLVSIVVDAFTATVCGFLAYYSWVFVHDSRAYGDTMLGDWPAWLFQLILPVAFALISYRYTLGCLRHIAGDKQ